jgi:hypothetical protein
LKMEAILVKFVVEGLLLYKVLYFVVMYDEDTI